MRPSLSHFTFAHLPPDLAAVSQPFAELANRLALDLPEGPESDTCLRKLLEAGDCAVRAALAARPVAGVSK